VVALEVLIEGVKAGVGEGMAEGLVVAVAWAKFAWQGCCDFACSADGDGRGRVFDAIMETPRLYKRLNEEVMLLSLNSRFVGNVYIIRCVGRVVLGEEVKALETTLETGTREFVRVVLDLSEVSRLDSIAMGLLVRYAERLGKAGGGLRLAAAPPFVVNLLNMTKLSTILPSYATEEEAIVSFLKQGSAEGTRERRGARVIVVDESADLCTFVRTVLTQHGYDVKSTCSFRDAKILLGVDDVEYIVVGPGNPQLSAETVVNTLTALAPKATALRLDADFKIRDAREATEALLQMFGDGGTV
jgi:anti-anti-sigma factor